MFAASNFSRGFSSFLDFSRWLAAFVVFFGHLRDPLFVGYPDLPTAEQTLAVKIWYFLSGLGGSSVIVFFLLSGFLVGGIGARKLDQGTFDPKNYAIDRISRLYIVFIPALFLTFVLDYVGHRFSRDTDLWNASSVLMGKNFGNFTENLTWPIFLKNLVMLQEFYGSYFGSDKPLWTLSYEFWFYVSFGLFAMFALENGTKRIVFATLIVCIMIALGPHFVVLSGIWLIGVGVSRYRGTKLVKPMLSAAVFVVTCLAERFGNLESGSSVLDYILIFSNAFAFAWVMISVRNRPLTVFAKFSELNKTMAGFSYTLYLTHFPLMLFYISFVASVLNLHQLKQGFLPSSTIGLTLYCTALLFVLGATFLIARLTEAHTDQLRAYFKSAAKRVRLTGGAKA
jgi:peptidoglycan/LPS O-acetylase OafA/YrhL